MLKAVIFDMDGVLIDSEPFHLSVDKILLKKYGINVDDAVFSKYVGVTNLDLITDLKNTYNLRDTIPDLLKIQFELKMMYLEEYNEGPINGIVELLDDLQKHKITMAVASSSPFQFIQVVLRKLKLQEYFSVIVSGDSVMNGKPDPEIFLKTIEALNVFPQECIVIEDSSHGVNAAYAAGIRSIGFKNPNSLDQNLNNATLIVDSIVTLNFNVLNNILTTKE